MISIELLDYGVYVIYNKKNTPDIYVNKDDMT